MNSIQGTPQPEKGKYKVYVRTITYNQSEYIVDTFNGVAMQQTNFPFVHCVYDDCSTDGEQDVIKKWLAENCQMDDAVWYDNELAEIVEVEHNTNPNLTVVIYFFKRNLYKEPKVKGTQFVTWREVCDFEALCEGDDYWTDPMKLQKQVDLLECDTNKGVMAVVTNTSVVDKDGNELKPKQDDVVPNNEEGIYDLRSFMYKVHHYPTATVLYRNSHVEELAEMKRKTANAFFGDWTLWIALHILGDFYYLDEVTSAYRINPTSLTHLNINKRRLGLAKANFKIIKSVQSILPAEYEDIRKSLDNTAWMWFDLAHAYKKNHKYFSMSYAMLRCFLKQPSFFFKKVKEYTKDAKA